MTAPFVKEDAFSYTVAINLTHKTHKKVFNIINVQTPTYSFLLLFFVSSLEKKIDDTFLPSSIFFFKVFFTLGTFRATHSVACNKVAGELRLNGVPFSVGHHAKMHNSIRNLKPTHKKIYNIKKKIKAIKKTLLRHHKKRHFQLCSMPPYKC